MKPTHKRLIMGTMGLGGSWESPDYEPADIDLAHAVLEKAKEIGIDTLDTADIYRHGASESVIGEVFKRDRELERHFRVQTKCCIQLPNLQHPWTRYNSAGTYIREAIELSARKLGRAPEIMLLHRFDPLMDRSSRRSTPAPSGRGACPTTPPGRSSGLPTRWAPTPWPTSSSSASRRAASSSTP